MEAKKICIYIIFLLSVFTLTGCSESDLNKELYEKVEKEIEYLDEKIILLSNSLNGIHIENYKVETYEVPKPKSSSNGESSGGGAQENGADEGNNSETINVSYMKTTSVLVNQDVEIDWDYAKSEVELLFSTWDTIVLDLYKLKVPTNLVNDFSMTLNNLTISLKDENKGLSLDLFATLYSYLPLFLQYTNSSENMINVKATKEHLLRAYAILETQNWDVIDSEINLASTSYAPLITNLGYIKNREHLVNRIYVMLNELKNGLTTRDIDVFKINYKNIMNELTLL